MSHSPHEIQEILRHLHAGGSLGAPLAERFFELTLSGQLNDAQLGAILAIIAARGADSAEVVAGVRVLRRHMTPLTLSSSTAPHETTDSPPIVLDTCGTGGAPKVFNISTVAAFVVAAAAPGRVLVAKHGGRSRTGRGSAEVLQHLGANIHASPALQVRCLRELGICFSFAPDHHPAMRHALAARKSLGFPTIFNLVGPLANPAGASHQLVGTFDPRAAHVLAQAMQQLGSQRAAIVTNPDGLDELTTTSVNDLLLVTQDSTSQRQIDPRELGYSPPPLEHLRAHTLGDAAEAVHQVLDGAPGPRRDIVELNAAAALWTAGAAPDLPAGLASARDAILSRRAKSLFDRFCELSRSDAP
ncbi:MAG: anthranilate phosphoribosyltransferase [Phycisphaerales bacterium]